MGAAPPFDRRKLFEGRRAPPNSSPFVPDRVLQDSVLKMPNAAGSRIGTRTPTPPQNLNEGTLETILLGYGTSRMLAGRVGGKRSFLDCP